MDKILFKVQSGQTLIGMLNYSVLIDALQNGVKYFEFKDVDVLSNGISAHYGSMILNLDSIEYFTLISKGDSDE